MARPEAWSPAQVLWRIPEAALSFVGEVTLIGLDAFRRLFRRPFEWSETLAQMAFVGVASVPIVALTTFFSGAVLALYTSEFLLKYGAGQFVGSAVGLAVTREIAPVLAGIMVSARCGSAMAAQIGTMAVTEQIDALRMLSVHPTNFLVIPRLLASIVMLPVLALVGVHSGIIGGWMVAVSAGLPSGSFWRSLQTWVEPWDVVGGLLKTPFFGLIIALVACQQGLATTQGAVGVGKATTRTVVLSMVLVYVANYFLAEIFY